MRVPAQVVTALEAEHAIRRRAMRFWRIVSIVAAVGAGLLWWPLGIAAFAFFQFIAYATHWHSVRTLQASTGLTEAEQALVLRSSRPENTR